uniref:MORN repeat-containing protein 5 n=1 Tax=Strigamia maritima TaxID=126957 RepID=T1J407_STRMM
MTFCVIDTSQIKLMEYIGSSYKGKRDLHRHFDDNKGTYNYPTKSKFRGEFKDGQFEGKGVVYLENGTEFKGQWSEGCYTSGNIIFSDGLQWKHHDWVYCAPQDRRFYSETVNGLRPAGCSKFTDKDPSPKIPDRCYDTGDGFYDPKTGIVTGYKGKFLRHASRFYGQK